MADELFDVRNSYVIGNYHQTIAEANSAKTFSKKPEDVQAFNTDRDALIALAQIQLQQYDAVLNDLRHATAPYLVAIRHYCQVSKDLSLKMDHTTALGDLLGLIKDATPNGAQGPIAALCANALMSSQEVSEAVKLVGTWASKIDGAAFTRQAVELRAILADGLLRLNRPDLAEKEVAQIKNIDDESIVGFLTAATVALRQGATKKEKFAEAESAVSDAAMRSIHSVTTLNLLALAQMGQGKLQEAERSLLDALGKKSGDPDTMANLVLVASQLGKPSESTLRYVNQVKNNAPNAVWSTQYTTMEQRFADAAKVL